MRDHGVLLSWVDLRTDPYLSRPDGTLDRSSPGPTLTLLFDPDSPYRGRIAKAVLFYRMSHLDPRRHEDLAAAEATRREVDQHGQRRIDVELVPWSGEDPTDHRQIFEFLDPRVADIRARYPEAPLVVHLSPGTPAMQTVWVLMAEMGLIQPPFTVVKSLRRAFRGGRPAVVPVSLDIPTFYKAFQQAKPRHVAAPEAQVLFDPRHFVSDRLKQLYDRARRFARLNVPVLILGERGTGKTTLASWIRSNSPFRQPEKDQSWPSVPCSQYSPETLRAELFGYVKGAFTDARQDTEGLLHVADGDTLFLDEIGDISRDLQRLLIRALEEKRFTRVGARTPEKSDFRLVTATNLSWATLHDRLDPDFLDRISPLVLEVPPLREIREDLPWLWRHIFAQAVRRARVEGGTVPLDDGQHDCVVRQLARHPLPGNLRDLFRVAYHLIAASIDGETLEGTEALVTEALRQGTASPAAHEADDPARSVAVAFANHQSLDALMEDGASLATKEVERALRRYLAEELRRIARLRGQRPQELCDVTDRTLQQWVKL